jgi:hypothetical protein
VCVIAYVSGHGLGHSAREVEILRHLPSDVPLVVKSAAPEWFWRAEMRRPFTWVTDEFDVGCIQRDSLQIDIPATLRAWQRVAAQNADRYAAEADYLRRSNARVVVSDIPSLPLVAAARAGLPALCVANFTWVDIYRRLAEEEPTFHAIADGLTGEYAEATLLLEAGLSLHMPYFRDREAVGLVARPGRERRTDLLRHLPESASGKRLALVYVSGWGLPIPYERAEAFEEWHFFSLDAPPYLPNNWSVVPRDALDHPDLVASADLVVSKPGYGLAAECLSLGTPLLFPPRPAFAEYDALAAALTAWPGGIPLPVDAFLKLRWRPYLDQIPIRGVTPSVDAPGGPKVAQAIVQHLG